MLNRTGSSISTMIQSKAVYERSKDFATSINDLKTFAKPNLDDGNRFFDDNLKLMQKYGQGMVPAGTQQRSGFKPYKTKKSEAVVDVTNRLTTHTRSYRFQGGYTPKIYATRPKTAAYLKFKERSSEQKQYQRRHSLREIEEQRQHQIQEIEEERQAQEQRRPSTPSRRHSSDK